MARYSTFPHAPFASDFSEGAWDAYEVEYAPWIGDSIDTSYNVDALGRRLAPQDHQHMTSLQRFVGGHDCAPWTTSQHHPALRRVEHNGGLSLGGIATGGLDVPECYSRQSSPGETSSSSHSYWTVQHNQHGYVPVHTPVYSLPSSSPYSPLDVSPCDVGGGYDAMASSFHQQYHQQAHFMHGTGGGISMSKVQPYDPDETTDLVEAHSISDPMQEDCILPYGEDEDTIRVKVPTADVRLLPEEVVHDASSPEAEASPSCSNGSSRPVTPMAEQYACDFSEHQTDAENETDGSDTEYKPNARSSLASSPRNSRRRMSLARNGAGRGSSSTSSKRGSRGSRSSVGSVDKVSGRVQKRSSTHTRTPSHSHIDPNGDAPVVEGAGRPFPCPLAPYGCTSTFASKNEWKRHVGTQHVKLGFWRCDMCPAGSNNISSDRTDVGGADAAPNVPNDFNRKDLFTQHLRRMHPSACGGGASTSTTTSTSSSPTTTTKPTKAKKQKQADPPTPVKATNAALVAVQKRCYVTLRSPPPRSGCLFCPRRFDNAAAGAGWNERMDHVGAHLEHDAGGRGDATGACAADWEAWNEDAELEGWLVDEGLIRRSESSGGWEVGDGTPLRDQ